VILVEEWTRLTDAQLREFSEAHAWSTARPIPDGRMLGAGKSSPARSDLRVEAVRERLGEGLRVLEVGACEAQHTVLLAPFCKEVVALEVRPRNVVGALIRQFVSGVRNVRNIVMDVRDLSPEMGPFDLVFHVGVLYHLANPVEHLFEVERLGAGALLLDTHYATDALGKFPDSSIEHRGVTYRTKLYREQGWSDPFSGVDSSSAWLYRDDLLRLVNGIGFARIEILRDEIEPNGPRIGLLARR
jgi:tRNA (mo5U34)-methyltransferase